MRTSRSSPLPASYFKSPSTERTGEAAALGALSHSGVRADQTVSLATAAKFAGFTAEDRETLSLIETCFVTDDPFAFLAIVSAADRGRNRSGVFVYIIHYIEPSGRQPFGVHRGTLGTYSQGSAGSTQYIGEDWDAGHNIRSQELESRS